LAGGVWKPIGAAFFDYNGTIVDDAFLCYEAFRSVCEYVRTPIPEIPSFEEWRREGENLRDPWSFFSRRGVRVSRDELKRIFQAYLLMHEPLPLVADVTRVLDRFRRAGIPCAIVSRLESDILERDIEANNLRKYFGVYTFGGLREKASKFVELRKHFRCTVGEAVVFADTLPDLRQAKGAGCLTVACGFGHGHPETLETISPDLLIESWRTFLKAIRGEANTSYGDTGS
jgi:beta-phosphoglucomutase-like phosphatase (HAD superfamily)